jgi:hypothetical protein
MRLIIILAVVIFIDLVVGFIILKENEYLFYSKGKGDKQKYEIIFETWAILFLILCCYFDTALVWYLLEIFSKK